MKKQQKPTKNSQAEENLPNEELQQNQNNTQDEQLLIYGSSTEEHDNEEWDIEELGNEERDDEEWDIQLFGEGGEGEWEDGEGNEGDEGEEPEEPEEPIEPEEPTEEPWEPNEEPHEEPFEEPFEEPDEEPGEDWDDEEPEEEPEEPDCTCGKQFEKNTEPQALDPNSYLGNLKAWLNGLTTGLNSAETNPVLEPFLNHINNKQSYVNNMQNYINHIETSGYTFEVRSQTLDSPEPSGMLIREGNKFVILIDKKGITDTDELNGLVAHELVHLYQLLTGKLGFNSYGIEDEVEAYNMQEVLTSGYFTAPTNITAQTLLDKTIVINGQPVKPYENLTNGANCPVHGQ